MPTRKKPSLRNDKTVGKVRSFRQEHEYTSFVEVIAALSGTIIVTGGDVRVSDCWLYGLLFLFSLKSVLSKQPQKKLMWVPTF